MNKKNQSVFKTTLKMINYLYKYELMNEKINSIEAFESGLYTTKECQIIDKIGEIYNKLLENIEKYLDPKWKWNRLPILEKTLLIYGTFALQFSDKALIINEIVNITKFLIPGNNFQYINSILDKIGNEYEKIKNH